MPDLIDRTRLASIAVLAGFAMLSLALVSHIAVTGAPLSLPGLSGKGQVLTVPGQGLETSGTSGSPSGAPAAGAPATTGFLDTGSGTAATDNGGDKTAPADSGPPPSEQPRQVGISIGSAAPSPGSTPQSPGPTTTGGGSSGGGSNPAGTGSGQENGSQGAQPAGPSNNYGHSSPIPPVTPPSTGATPNGHSAGSQISGASGSEADSSTSGATSTTTTSSTITGAASGPSFTSSGGRFKYHSPGHSK
jgi:hypothetical protein